MTSMAAHPVTDASQVAEPRRAAQALTRRLDFPEETTGRAALIVTELGTNLAKHARGGEILLQPVADDLDGTDGIEILALDRGPGMTDLAISRRNGYSTAGTLGHGLGAVERQADQMDLFTHGSGTAVLARVWRERPPRPQTLARYEIGAVRVPKPGEIVCGDACAWRRREGRIAILVADGLGHGLPAHDAADAAIRTFGRTHEFPPERVILEAHDALKATRGAAIASMAIDLERNIARFAGLGNISGAILLPDGRRQNMVSHNGTAGHHAARIQEFTYQVPRSSIVVLCSDGLASQWNIAAYPGLQSHSASLVAGVLYRDFSRRRDDVTIVVAKERPAATEKL